MNKYLRYFLTIPSIFGINILLLLLAHEYIIKTLVGENITVVTNLFLNDVNGEKWVRRLSIYIVMMRVISRSQIKHKIRATKNIPFFITITIFMFNEQISA